MCARKDGGRTPRTNASGTVLMTPMGPPGSTVGQWGSAAEGTVVVTPSAGGGADYGAALLAVAESNGCALSVLSGRVHAGLQCAGRCFWCAHEQPTFGWLHALCICSSTVEWGVHFL